MMQTQPPLATQLVENDWTIPQDWTCYSAEDHGVWDTLFRRQSRILPGRVVPQFLAGIERLGLDRPGIPDFAVLSDTLMRATGWQVVAVPGLVPDAVFFNHLANRRFCAGNFIRSSDQLDYLQEPDVFHDVFGHVPLLADPVFADYMQAYGQGGLRSIQFSSLHRLARLYWYTVEFGLIETSEGVKIYGAGIVSSKGESVYALDSPIPHRIAFNLKRILRTKYKIDDYQAGYFVIESFEDLLERTLETDFAPLYQELDGELDIEAGTTIASDRVMTLGTQAVGRSEATV